jgi:hypothetical protein
LPIFIITGWSGAQCETATCTPGLCGHGTCGNTTNTCICDDNWIGTTCDESSADVQSLFIVSSQGIVATNPYANYIVEVPLKDPSLTASLLTASNQGVVPQLLRAWNGALFTIANSSLYSVNPYTGASQILALGHQVATGAVAIALTEDNYMYMIRAASLYYMSAESSFAPILFGEASRWIGTTAMAAVGYEVFVANDLGLSSIDTGMYPYIH